MSCYPYMARALNQKKVVMNYVFAPACIASVAVAGRPERFAVRRIYCVGQNYAAHAQEMGASGREAPFFFMKPSDAIVPVDSAEQVARISYPSLTSNLHYEVEWVVAIGQGGHAIAAANAAQHIFGYAVGLDMTRRDLQASMKQQARPWEIAKAFDQSAPIGAITPATLAGDLRDANIRLTVNDQERQNSSLNTMIWSAAEVIEQLSIAWTLQPGDLIFTGTPAGVGSVVPGDVLRASISGLSPLQVQIV